MYSRSSVGREDEGFRIPDGYRGNAFSPLVPPPPEATEAPPPPRAEEETLPIATDEVGTDESLPASSMPKPTSPLAALLPPKPSGAKGLLSDIGLEELLILGVILLISQSETDDDVLLLLLLLLFYK